jgi:peptidoglycan-N-acetylglucosamine deacetylase
LSIIDENGKLILYCEIYLGGLSVMNKKIKLIGIFILIFLGLFYTAKNYSLSYDNYNINDRQLANNTLTKLIKASIDNNEKGPKPRPEKIVYLTFDDGPSKYTDEIINILKNHNVQSTFFMINRNMKNYPEQVKNIVDDGHTPAFHSVTHNIHKLYESPKHTVEEFDICKETLYNITGVNSSIMRLPYGSKPYMPTDSYKELLKSKYKIWDWNLDTEDWKNSSQDIINNVEIHSKGKDEIILLMHEKDQTVQALDKIINYYKNNGYVFMKINQKEAPKNYWLNSFENN